MLGLSGHGRDDGEERTGGEDDEGTKQGGHGNRGNEVSGSITDTLGGAGALCYPGRREEEPR
jgi:hypothetical protein